MTRFLSSSVISLKCFCKKSSASSLVQEERRGIAMPPRAVTERLRMNSLRVYFLFCMFFIFFRRQGGWRFGLYRFKFGLMGIMAMGTEEVGSFSSAHKVSRSFPVDTRSPISVLRPMAFATEPIALREVDEFPVIKSQLISVFYIMAVEAPSHRLGMMKLDLGVFFFQFTSFPLDLQGGVAAAAGKHSLCHRRRGDRELLTRPLC